MDKREMIERALAPLLIEHFKHDFIDDSGFIDALADQAIVIECEVEHEDHGVTIRGNPYPLLFTHLLYNGMIFARLQGVHHGTPGKAIAIIVPLEEE